MDESAGVLVDGGFVVAEVGSVGGSDFAEDGGGLGHDFGHAEGPADFDELSAGDDDLFALGEGIEDEHGGGGVVIDDGGGFAGEEFDEEALGFFFAEGAVAAIEAGLEDGVVVGVGEGKGGFGAEWSAAEAGVEEDAGGIDGSSAEGPGEADESGAELCGELGKVGECGEAGADLRAEFVKEGTEFELGDALAELGGEGLGGGRIEDFPDGGDIAEELGVSGVHSGDSGEKNGGGAWESNPPGPLSDPQRL